MSYCILCCRGTPKAQLVRNTKRSPTDYMETPLCKELQLQFHYFTCMKMNALQLGSSCGIRLPQKSLESCNAS